MVSAEDLARHSNAGNCWVVVRGRVYNVTEWLSEHPGGRKQIENFAGKDATKAFDAMGHGDHHLGVLAPLLVGDLDGSASAGRPGGAGGAGGATVVPLNNLNAAANHGGGGGEGGGDPCCTVS